MPITNTDGSPVDESYYYPRAGKQNDKCQCGNKLKEAEDFAEGLCSQCQADEYAASQYVEAEPDWY